MEPMMKGFMDTTARITTWGTIPMAITDTALTGAATDGVDIFPTGTTGAGGKQLEI